MRLFLENALNLLHSNSIRQAGDAALDAWICVVVDTATCEGKTNHVWQPNIGKEAIEKLR